MKKNDYIDINYRKESKYNKTDIFEIDILGREVKFIEKEKSEAQLIPIKRRRGPRAAQHPTPPITSTSAYDGSSALVASVTGSIPEEWVISSNVTSVTFANNGSLTSIGRAAFKNNLVTRVIIPNSVILIGNDTFQNNTLSSVTIGNNVTNIGSDAFSNNSLTLITLPNALVSIGNGAFIDNDLTSVIMGNNVTSIGNSAFKNNVITAITFPALLTSIGNNAFQNNALTNVIIPNSVNSLGNSAFQSNDLTAVTIGNNVTSIGNEAFIDNLLTSLIIPTSVNSIGSDAFKGNNNLASVNCLTAFTSFVGTNAFENTASPLIIHVRATDTSWTIGEGLSVQGNNNVNVINDL